MNSVILAILLSCQPVDSADESKLQDEAISESQEVERMEKLEDRASRETEKLLNSLPGDI